MSVKLVIIVACLSLALANVLRFEQLFLDHEVVPDVLSSPPEGTLKVTFSDGVEAQLGNELLLSQVGSTPAVEWDYDPAQYYTLVFCDPDAPSRANPEVRSYLHWLVVNIPGDDVTSGVTLSSFLPSGPRPGTGLHRYVFLVYEQPGVVDFEEQLDGSLDESRPGFSAEKFAAKYNLGTPVAGNFYQTQNLDK